MAPEPVVAVDKPVNPEQVNPDHDLDFNNTKGRGRTKRHFSSEPEDQADTAAQQAEAAAQQAENAAQEAEAAAKQAEAAAPSPHRGFRSRRKIEPEKSFQPPEVDDQTTSNPVVGNEISKIENESEKFEQVN